MEKNLHIGLVGISDRESLELTKEIKKFGGLTYLLGDQIKSSKDMIARLHLIIVHEKNVSTLKTELHLLEKQNFPLVLYGDGRNERRGDIFFYGMIDRPNDFSEKFSLILRRVFRQKINIDVYKGLVDRISNLEKRKGEIQRNFLESRESLNQVDDLFRSNTKIVFKSKDFYHEMKKNWKNIIRKISLLGVYIYNENRDLLYCHRDMDFQLEKYPSFNVGGRSEAALKEQIFRIYKKTFSGPVSIVPIYDETGRCTSYFILGEVLENRVFGLLKKEIEKKYFEFLLQNKSSQIQFEQNEFTPWNFIHFLNHRKKFPEREIVVINFEKLLNEIRKDHEGDFYFNLFHQNFLSPLIQNRKEGFKFCYLGVEKLIFLVPRSSLHDFVAEVKVLVKTFPFHNYFEVSGPSINESVLPEVSYFQTNPDSAVDKIGQFS